jgi:hypothetical protein
VAASMDAWRTWSDHCVNLSWLVFISVDRYTWILNTSIFLNSVHLASSALSGLTRLILGACGIVRVLAGREADVSVRWRRLSRRRWLMDNLYTGWNQDVCCVGVKGVGLHLFTFKWWSMSMTSMYSRAQVPRARERH